MLANVTTPQDLDERFRRTVAGLAPPALPGRGWGTLDPDRALRLFEAQMTSRHLDLAARWLRSFGEGYYTIGSAGHEGNAAVAEALRWTDPALLHYRSGAFYCVRAGQPEDSGVDPVRDVLRGIVASAAEPIAGGRHKVFGNRDLNVLPTTSTIASHLPRAVGMAFAIERARGDRRRKSAPVRVPGNELEALVGAAPAAPGTAWPADALVVCSFGDASINHAAAVTAFNATGWCDHSGLKLPILYVCEDNGLGISVKSPAGWTEAALRSKPGIRYWSADGTDLAETFATATEAADWVRRHRRPAILHLRTVRLMGHAGADAEQGYRTPREIAADIDRDPLLISAARLVDAGVAVPEELVARYDEIGWQVRKTAEEVMAEPKLSTVAEIVAPLAPRRPVRVARVVAEAGERAAGPLAVKRAPEPAGPVTLAQAINATLADALVTNPAVVLFGEDVAAKGGVYGVTKGLRDRFGPARVFDTLLDETTILGLAAGAGSGGLLPVPEIQYLAYLHNAEDQLRGEAASLSFFSSGRYRNPMVVRVAGLAYQEGFGGHFHNDNSLAVLRDIPGLVLAVPARADDAAAMLRTCLAAATADGTVCAFVEPIALYHTRDLYEPGDGQWLSEYPPPGRWGATHVPIGRARTYGIGHADALTIVTFGNGVRMSLRVAAQLAAEGIGSRVVDLRWLAPLPEADLVREAAATGRVLIVDETRRSGGVSEGILATLVDAGYVGAVRRVSAADTYVPLGPAARTVLVGEDVILAAARTLLTI
ncbi:transketolase C-terminal domain-containing protein [Hamadaea tsunoensis]|uniref:transketolase C-terminal domain-containing protein n=1 Tax=Hamadaea tsunoensis TaxID=53368 RepID=UPI0003F85487|nr:transketolase C-terminal domain-containing protein [Hamadaea tsunoensis]